MLLLFHFVRSLIYGDGLRHSGRSDEASHTGTSGSTATAGASSSTESTGSGAGEMALSLVADRGVGIALLLQL